MDTNQVLDHIRQIQASDSAIRHESQLKLDQYGMTDPSRLVLGLAAISGEQSIEVNSRQMSLVILRLTVLKHWSIGFDDFIGPAINPEAKQQVRKMLMQLIGSPDSKVRASGAQLLARIASVEFPEEWPSLIQEVMQLTQSGSNEQIQGSLQVMNEILYDALSAEEFLAIGPTLLPVLYKVAASGGDSSYSLVSKKDAISCFKRCLMFYEQIDHPTESALNLARNAVGQWFELFNQLLREKIEHPGQLAAIQLKVEIITAIREIEIGLERIVTDNIVPLFSAVWTDLVQLHPLYLNTYIFNDITPEPVGQEDRDVKDTSLDQLVCAELSFVEHCISQVQQVQSEFEEPSLIQQFASIVVSYAQLPKDTQEEYAVNDFITEENDMCMEDRVRFDVANVVSVIDLPQFVGALWMHTENAFNSGEGTWVTQESCLYLISRVLWQGKKQALSKLELASFELCRFVSECLSSEQSPPQLQARSLLLAGLMAKELNIDVATKEKFMQEMLRLGANSQHALVRAASLFTVKKYCDVLGERLQPHQETLFSIISSLVPVAEEDSPAFLVEVLQYSIQLNYEAATRSSSIMQLLFTLASKDTANVELTTETSDVFEDMVEYATANGYYAEVCQNALPTLMNGLGNMKDFEYSPDAMLAIGLIGELINHGPAPLPAEILDHVLTPLYEIITGATDTEMLQAASESFNYLVAHASEQLKSWRGNEGPQMLLKVCSKLLDPALDDSATINSGPLISTVITKFGSDLGDIFKQLLEAVVVRLSTAENLVLVQNLVSVFSDLVLQSPREVVDILWDMNVQNSRGLQVVLAKWLGSFDVLRGYEEIKKNVVALQHLFEIDDDRVKNIFVDGDLENPEPGVILTRSRAKNLTYQQIAAHVKIVKLLVSELSTTPFDTNDAREASWLAGAGANGDGSDDEWEDVPGGSEFVGEIMASMQEQESPKHQVDSETHTLIIEWFKRMAETNVGSIRSIYETQLTADERNILNEHARV